MRLLTGFGLFLGAVLAAGAAVAQDTSSSAQQVTVAKITKQITGKRGRYVGRVTAISTVDLQARISGFLEKRSFQEGGLVNKGDVLFVIEKDLYQASVDQAKAQVASAEATLENSQVDLQRKGILVAKDDVARSTYDSAVAQVKVDQASVDQAKANLETANINLSYTQIFAPISGRISKANVDAGNLVNTSTGTLATINSVDPIYVTFYMGEKELIKDREKGLIGENSATLKATIILADGTEYPSAGKINYVGTNVEETSDTIELRSVVPNPKGVLIPGQFVNIVVEDAKPKAQVVVPQAAVQLDNKGNFVYLVDKTNKVVRRDVKLGKQAGAVWEVSSGLSAGDTVITQGLQKVSPGDTVVPVEAKQASQG